MKNFVVRLKMNKQAEENLQHQEQTVFASGQSLSHLHNT
jgi:hypothetical protein